MAVILTATRSCRVQFFNEKIPGKIVKSSARSTPIMSADTNGSVRRPVVAAVAGDFDGNILIIGGGGREAAIAWKLATSPLIVKSTNFYLAPGNATTATAPPSPLVNWQSVSTLLVTDHNAVIDFVHTHSVSLVVVGPEDPLSAGIVDALTVKGIRTFGPTKAAAQLESSKAYAKSFMTKHNIPTAASQTFTDMAAATAYLSTLSDNTAVVVKASGLCAGKGVIMCPSLSDARSAVHAMLVEHSFGDAGRTVVIEQWLNGTEISVLAFSDGRNVSVMPIATDHKRIWEFQRGPNTGGMGCVAPNSAISQSTIDNIKRVIIQRCIDGCRQDGHPFVGVLFAGVMIDDATNEPYTLEYNVRLGDPETQTLLPLLRTDLLSVILACCNGTLKDIDVQWAKDTYATTVCAVSLGYPSTYEKGHVISKINGASADDERVMVFQAGTKWDETNKLTLTNGGRVLAVTATSSDPVDATRRAYRYLDQISFTGLFYRRDIGSHIWHRPHHETQPIRLGILGSTNGTDLIAIHNAIQTGRLHAQIVMIISDRTNAGILEKAKNYNYNHLHLPYNRKSNMTREEYDHLIIHQFQLKQTDLILCIGYMRILSDDIINAFEHRILNVHPSLLPRHAGGMDLSVHEAVITAGETISGCTVHLIDHGAVDGGPILVQRSCSVVADETAESLKKKVQQLEGEAFIDAIKLYSDDQYFLQSISQGLLPSYAAAVPTPASSSTEQSSPSLPSFLYRLYRTPLLTPSKATQLIHRVNTSIPATSSASSLIKSIDSEYCFYIEFDRGSNYTSIGQKARQTLIYLLSETFEREKCRPTTFLAQSSSSSSAAVHDDDFTIIEVGPRLSFTSAWSTNAVSICQSVGLPIIKIERYRRYCIRPKLNTINHNIYNNFLHIIHDRMTEYILNELILTFNTYIQPEQYSIIPLLTEGILALKKQNNILGLGLDDFDLNFIYNLFKEKLKRNPNTIELFDLSQSNSEHSRHWFFRGQIIINNIKTNKTLMELVKSTLITQYNHNNSLIAFSDNSSVIKGFTTTHIIQPSSAIVSSRYEQVSSTRHLLLTAETHNFPSGVAPFPGAETGTGRTYT